MHIQILDKGRVPNRITYALCGTAILIGLFLPSRWAFLLLPLSAAVLAYTLSPVWRRRMMYAIGTLAVLTPVAARATGWPVFDLASFAQLARIWGQNASTYTKVVEEVQTAQKIYSTTMQNYELAVAMSHALASKNIYAVRGAIMMGAPFVANHFGEAAGWNAAMTIGNSIPTAYNRATLPMLANTTFLAAQQLGQSSHLANLATVGIIDDTSQRAMQTTAQINQQQSANQSAISGWERSVNSADPALNTTAAQQNLANLGMVQMYEQGKANLAVNSILAQQLTVQNMALRDQQVVDLNRWQQLDSYTASEPLFWGSGSEARTDSPW